MKKVVIRTAYQPEKPRVYQGEHIYRVVKVRGTEDGYANRQFGLDNGVWVKEIGPDKYVTNWTNEERWGRVEEVEVDEAGREVSAVTLGFMILRVDRRNGVL